MIKAVKEKTGRCPNCDNKVVQKSGSETKLRIAHPVYFNADGRCIARCHWCKSELELPVRLEAEIEAETFTIPSGS